MLEETAEERETRLENRREPWKRRTAETKGKQKEYNRMYRQQKEAEECAEERETRLAKRRETWQERTPEARGKRKEYSRLHSIEKVQNETKEERVNRLQNRKQKLSLETPDERARRLECLRAHFRTVIQNETVEDQDNRRGTNRIAAKKRRSNINGSCHKSGEKDGPDHEEIERIVSFCEELASIIYSVPEEGEESGSVPEPQGVSKHEYLHQGGWQNVDNPFHEQEFVQNEMHSFHLDQERLEHRQCTICKEAWPKRQNLASEVFICYRCKRDKKSPKKFSAENDMDPGTVTEQLRGLTQVEEMLISRVCPIMRVCRRHGGQRGYKGHVLNLPHEDIQSFLNRLPSRVADLPVLIV